MTSEERHAARRARREARRAARRAERQRALTLEAVADLDNLWESARLAARGVRWKYSVQRYMGSWARNIVHSRRQLLAGKSVTGPVREFDIVERGKPRHITAVSFRERVVQKSLARNALMPALGPSLIRNCTANIPGRGTGDAVRRLKRALSRHYREHVHDGYIAIMDVRDYFGSIPHDGVVSMVSRAVDDQRIAALYRQFAGTSGGRGLGLGSEPNQDCAVAYPSPIDHYATEVLRLPYGRHMDDSWLLAPDRETAERAIAAIGAMYRTLGLELHSRKTKVVKLSHGFTWLKKRWRYGERGRVVVRPARVCMTRERRRLRGQARLVRRGEMTVDEVEQSYQSWRGGMGRIDAHRAVLAMDEEYSRLMKGVTK